MCFLSFTYSKSFTQSLFNTLLQPLPYAISIEPAFLGMSQYELNEQDPILQKSFRELIEDQFSRKLDYFIIIDQDEYGLCHLSDGFSYLKNYWSYSNSKNSLSRGEVKDFAIYRLSAFDSTQKMRYFCSKTDIDKNKGHLKHIEAHYPDYKEDLRANAFCDIAQEYYNGKSVFGKNERESYAWYKRAALTFGHSKAFACLAILKKEGGGTKSSLSKSILYLQKAAQGTTNGRVCYLFAEALEKGLGTDQNLSEALNWYQKALDLGCQEAKKKRDFLAQENKFLKS